MKNLARRAALAAAVPAVTALDAWRCRGRGTADLASDVTVCVKTFERPAVMARFVRSTRRIFSGRIVVADDSRRPFATEDPGVTVIGLPFNSGVAVGRNAALAAVDTEFTLVTDDDIVFTRATGWDQALQYLQEHPEVDAVAASLVELPRWYQVGMGDSPLFHGAAPATIAPGALIGGLPVVAKAPQVYLARTASLRKVGWDEDLRMVDHRDFFSRASGTLVFVTAPFPAYHSRTPWNRFFTEHRNDVEGDFSLLHRKWSDRAAAGAPVRPRPAPVGSLTSDL